MSCELDPKEVLMHLRELGYHNITSGQLKEFINDLKKLIQHDITKRRRQPQSPDDSASSPLPNTTDESVSSSPATSSEMPQQPSVGKSSNVVEQVSCSSSESSIAPARRVLRECTKHFSQNQERGNLLRNKSAESTKSSSSKPTKTCDCAWRRMGCKCCEELMSQEQNSLKSKSKENLAPPRPKSSFIRTWQTQGSNYRTQKCDPVALYQQYQQLWKQQKLPGEDNHNDLRWSVRERLLGQQPLPRGRCIVCNCPCKLSEKSFSKIPKKVSSKILPRGPFYIEGRIAGPLGHEKKGEFQIKDGQICGVFEVISDLKPDNKEITDDPSSVTEDSRERGVWLSKSDIDKNKRIEGCNESQINVVNYSMTKEEEENRRKKHNKSTCKYCGLIHYMLSSSEGSDNDKSVRNIYPVGRSGQPIVHAREDREQILNRLNKPLEDECEDVGQRGFWHHQFSKRPDKRNEANRYGPKDCEPCTCQESSDNNPTSESMSPSREQLPRQITVTADVHREDVSSTLSPGSRTTRPTSTPIRSTASPHSRRADNRSLTPSDKRDRPVLNLATASQPRAPKNSDTYFETRIPVNMKGFHGEVKTEVEVHKRPRHEDNKTPAVTVATKVKIHKI